MVSNRIDDVIVVSNRIDDVTCTEVLTSLRPDGGLDVTAKGNAFFPVVQRLSSKSETTSEASVSVVDV